MPQLDLTWFVFNFFIAWLLVILIILITVNQNWFSNDLETYTNETNINDSKTNEWIW